MASFFAAAGLAEAAWQLYVLLCWTALFLVVAATVAALRLRSRIMAIVALALLVAMSLYLTPWNAFDPFPPEAYEDPDVVLWAPRFRRVGMAWVVVSVAAIPLLALAWFIARKRAAFRQEPGSVGQAPRN
jgi:hypothetical protein